MKRGFSSNIPDALLSGKSILILIVIMISAFSFSLGYLVGKKSDNFSEKTLIEAKKRPIESPPPVSADEFDRTVDKIIKQDMDVSRDTKHVAVKAETKSSERSKEMATKDIDDGRVYTIQVGAFKKIKDAERLKKRLDKKGYESYIVTVKFKKGNLYKVRAERYDTKSEAEAHATEIKKLKGLDAFVLVEK
jgi:cell division septation protein DedD